VTKSYFSNSELVCKCCGQSRLAAGFLDHLNALREACGHALSPNSVCRCDKHNKAEGGADGSMHRTGHPWGTCAADIGTSGWSGAKKHAFVSTAMRLGWSVGVAKTFIHVDRRSDYPASGFDAPILFMY
jgi:hypothetical protein